MANKNNANDAGKKNEGLSSSTSKDDLDSLMTTDTTESQMRNCALKGISEQYVEFRETARLLMFLIDCRDRNKLAKWLERLDTMTDEEGQLDRLQYIKYMVSILSGSFGLVDPFTSVPPDTIKPLEAIISPVVLADLLDDDKPETCQRKRKRKDKKGQETVRVPHSDYKFYEQQLFPPEGVICYAAAFSCL